MPDWKKLIASKMELAKKGSTPGKRVSNARVPAGQTEVNNFPRLDLGIVPNVTIQNWHLRIFGLVEHELKLDWTAFQEMPQVTDISDFHCVTRWSQLDMDWQGVRVQDLLALVKPTSSAKYVTLHSYDGYTTNLPLEALLDEDVLLAHSVLGVPLTAEHGGPVRLVVP